MPLFPLSHKGGKALNHVTLFPLCSHWPYDLIFQDILRISSICFLSNAVSNLQVFPVLTNHPFSIAL